MNQYFKFCEYFMDIQRELREGKLPLDEALDSFKDLECDIAIEMARDKKNC